jgi:hypothetical protein
MAFVFVKLTLRTAIITGIVGGLFIIIINSSQFVQGQNNASPDALVFPVDSKPYGKSYADWSAIWWQWLLSIPEDKSPAGDSTGEDCGTNQQGPIWFLAGTFGGSAERTCTIPSGKAIMFSPINSECSYAEYPDEKTESDLLECAKTFQDQTTSAQVTINGTAIENLDQFRIQSPPFNVTIPENNVFGVSSGPTQAVSDGLWVILKPLPVGEHKIGFKGSSVDFTTGAKNTFVSDANYNVIVK